MEIDENAREALLGLLNDSPMYRYMQMKVVEAGNGHARLTMNAREDLHSLYGMLHGGAIATIADSACGIALGSLLEPGEICVTLDLRINFIANMKKGTLVAEGLTVHRGRKTGVARAEISDGEGNIIASAMSTHHIGEAGGVRMAPEVPGEP